MDGNEIEPREEIISEAFKGKGGGSSFIETYDVDTGDLEGVILLKDGNRTGLAALVKLIKEVEVKQDHFADIDFFVINGKLIVKNQSTIDRLWDIDITLKKIENTNLNSDTINIRELGITEEENIYSQEFQETTEAKHLLLFKEYINTLPEGNTILNLKNIEVDLLKLKDRSYNTSLECYEIPTDKSISVSFAIAMRSLFEKPIKNIKVTKNIPGDFSNPVIRDTSVGRADVEGKKIIWNIEKLMPETTVLLKFTCGILVSDITRRRTGTIDVTYQGASSFAEDLTLDKFDAYTNNEFYIDTVKSDDEPNIWYNKLIFNNTSEFVIQLFNADVYSPEDQSTKFVDIDPNDVPLLPAGAQWHSRKWQYKSEDKPTFRKKLEFRVMPDFQTSVLGTINISDAEIGPPIKRHNIIQRLDKVENMINIGDYSKSVYLLKSIIFQAKISKFEDIIRIAQEKLKAIKELETKKKSLEKILFKIKDKIQEKTITETITELKNIINVSKTYNFKEVLYTARDLLNFYDELLNIKNLIEKEQISNAIIRLNEIIREATIQKYKDVINQANVMLNLWSVLEEKEIVKKEIKEKSSSIEDLIKEEKFETAVKELNDLKLTAKKKNLNDTIDWVEQKLELCTKLKEEKIRMDKMNIIKKTILDLGIKFGRLQIMEISEVCSIKEEQLIIDTIKEMINNKEIYAQYFSSTKSVAFDQQANIDEIDKLMSTYRDWEDKEVGKK